VNYQDAPAMFNNDGILGLGSSDRFKTGAGSGFPPSPVPVIVKIRDKKY
jgi:hypothetical protein